MHVIVKAIKFSENRVRLKYYELLQISRLLFQSTAICTITTDGDDAIVGGGMPAMDIVFVLDATPSGGTSTTTWLSIINVVKALVR